MKSKDLIILYVLGMAVLIVAASFQNSPGYMDAEYYASIARRIAGGDGITEPFVWNYLGGKPELPMPAFQYWKPLPSLAAALSMHLFQSLSFNAGRGLLILAASFSPVLTAIFAYQFSGERKIAFIGGIFACFPAFYLPFLTTTDSFALYILGGGVIFYLLNRDYSGLEVILIGVVSGLMGLTRAEGLIWLGISGLGILLKGKKKFQNFLFLGFGALSVWLPWTLWNQLVLGNSGAVEGLKTLWLTSYNEIFSYQVDLINFNSWVESGFRSILLDRASSTWANFKTLLFVQGQILLVPFVIAGLIKNRNNTTVQAALIGLGTSFAVMSILFPYAGKRGGYFHSGAGWQIFIWVLSACGFSDIIKRGKQALNWKDPKAFDVFGAGLIVILAAVSAYTAFDKLGVAGGQTTRWDQDYENFLLIGSELEKIGLEKTDLVLINNPPGLYFAANQWSIVIPDGGIDDLLQAAEDYNAQYLILEKNHPDGLDDLYSLPANNEDERLKFLFSSNGNHFFKIFPGEDSG